MSLESFDINEFKKKVKDWMRNHPDGAEAELLDFCEDLVPTQQFASNRWVFDHTIAWYRSILQSRTEDHTALDDDDNF